jgi:hypothetical protein
VHHDVAGARHGGVERLPRQQRRISLLHPRDQPGAPLVDRVQDPLPAELLSGRPQHASGWLQLLDPGPDLLADHHRNQVAHLQVLKLGDDAARAGDPLVVDPVQGIPARPAAADLHQPGPDVLGARVDGDGSGRPIPVASNNVVTGKPSRDLLVGRAPPHGRWADDLQVQRAESGKPGGPEQPAGSHRYPPLGRNAKIVAQANPTTDYSRGQRPPRLPHRQGDDPREQNDGLQALHDSGLLLEGVPRAVKRLTPQQQRPPERQPQHQHGDEPNDGHCGHPLHDMDTSRSASMRRSPTTRAEGPPGLGTAGMVEPHVPMPSLAAHARRPRSSIPGQLQSFTSRLVYFQERAGDG